MEQRARRPGHTVPRPGFDEVGLGCEMGSRVDVPVGAGDDDGVIALVPLEEFGDAGGDRGTTGHGQRTPFAEVVLNVDDQQGAAHHTSSVATSAGGPAS